MMKSATTILLIIFCFCLFACSSHKHRQPKFTEVFATKIFDNGTKVFSYRLSSAGPEGRGVGDDMNGAGRRGGPEGGRGRGGRRPMGGSDDRRAQMEERLADRLEDGVAQKLKDTGYCRDGYLKLDQTIAMGEAVIRGECNEGASEQDRQNFPNPKPVKIIEESLD